MGKKRRSRAFKENNQIIDFEEERSKRREKRRQLSEKKKTAPSQEKHISDRRAAKRLKRRLISLAVLSVVIGVVCYSAYNVLTLRAERAEAEAAYAALEKQKADLEKELTLIDTDEYIEEKAREELHMILPGELIYVLPNEEDQDTPSSIVVTDDTAATDANGALLVTQEALDVNDDTFLDTVKDIFQSLHNNLKSLLNK